MSSRNIYRPYSDQSIMEFTIKIPWKTESVQTQGKKSTFMEYDGMKSFLAITPAGARNNTISYVR